MLALNQASSIPNWPALRFGHTAAAFAHAGQALAAGLLLYSQKNKDKGFFKLVRFKYEKAEQVIESDYLKALIVAFPCLSAVNHLWAAFDYNGSYQGYLQTKPYGYNPVRWAEYGLSAGIMVWIISNLSGNASLPNLVGLAIANVALQLSGLFIEKTNDPSFGLTSSAWVLFLSIWVPIFIHFYSSLEFMDKDEEEEDDEEEKEEEDDSLPVFVYTIVFTQFFLFAGFGLLNFLHRRGVRRKEQKERGEEVTQNKFDGVSDALADMNVTEWGYLLLSLTSKSLLTWLVVGGALGNPEGQRTTTKKKTKKSKK